MAENKIIPESNEYFDRAYFSDSDYSSNDLNDQNEKENQIIELVSYLQTKYPEKYSNTNTLFSYLRDKELGKKIGFEINSNKRGADLGKFKKEDPAFFRAMEVKSIGESSKNVIFEDCTFSKVECFRDTRILVGISISNVINKVGYMVVGRTSDLADDMENLVGDYYNGDRKGRVQFIKTIPTLISDYNFKVVPIDWSKEEVMEHIKEHISKRKITYDSFITLDEMNEIYGLN